jgi:kumamolisin
MLPADVSNVITGVFGLDSHAVLRRLFRKRRLVDPRAFEDSRRRSGFFVPPDLAPVYNFPNVDASGQCLGLLEFGGGVDQSDIAPYFRKIGVPVPNIQIIAAEGTNTDPSTDPDSTAEVALDIAIAGALSGGAKVAVYFSTPDEKGLIDALSTVIHDSVNDPSVVSISWGSDENQPFGNQVPWSLAAIDHVNQSLLAMAQLGITVCVATGDDGAGGRIKDGKAHVNFPATSPYVLAVGGTTLRGPSGKDGQIPTEVVWNDGPGSGTGGGVSDITPVPNWQDGKVPRSINPGNFAGRAIPDVAANADPDTGYLIIGGEKPWSSAERVPLPLYGPA